MWYAVYLFISPSLNTLSNCLFVYVYPSVSKQFPKEKKKRVDEEGKEIVEEEWLRCGGGSRKR